MIKKVPIIDINGKRLVDQYKKGRKPFRKKVNKANWTGETVEIHVYPKKNKVIIGGNVEVKLEEDKQSYEALHIPEYKLYFHYLPVSKKEKEEWDFLGRLYKSGAYWTAVDDSYNGLSRESKDKWEAIAQLVCNVI